MQSPFPARVACAEYQPPKAAYMMRADLWPEAPLAPPGNATTLVVDNSKNNRDLILQTLAPFGYRV